MTRPLLPLAALLLAAGCARGPEAPVRGIVNVAPELLGRARAPNTVLFIVARNGGGVPVAVRQVVNPEFPFRFTIGPDDLLLPGEWRGAVTLTARLATRTGPDGAPVIDAEAARPARAGTGSGERDAVYLFLDKALQAPAVASVPVRAVEAAVSR